MAERFTPLERFVWKDECIRQGVKPIPRLESRPDCVPGLRLMIRRASFHEAGHVAVDAFFMFSFECIRFVTIIPTDNGLGNCRVEFGPTVDTISRLDPESRIPEAWKGMMLELGGWCAQMISDGEEPDSDAFIAECEHMMNGPDDEWDYQKDKPQWYTDFGRAWAMAELLVCPGWPIHKRLLQGLAWTSEILHRPDVEYAVDNFAFSLRMNGTVECGEDLDSYFEDVQGLWCKSPHRAKWFRRLKVPKAAKALDVGGKLD